MSEVSGVDRPPPEAPDEAAAKPATRMFVDVGVYLVARLALAAVLGIVIGVIGRAVSPNFPLTVAVLFALVLAMPLGIWVFGIYRKRATASIAAFDQRRRRDREQLQARLRGE